LSSTASTPALESSSTRLGHKGFGTKPGQDLVHTFLWSHRSSTGRGRLTGNGDLRRTHSGSGTSNYTAPRCWGRGRFRDPPQLVRGSRIRQEQDANSARTDFSEVRRHGFLQFRPTLISGTRSRNEQNVSRRRLGKTAYMYASSSAQSTKLPSVRFKISVSENGAANRAG
jgi:hypothetical protein